MEFLDENDINLELPESAEINRYLFTEEIEKHNKGIDDEFDIDKFLMDNNFHYMELDPLIRDMSGLSNDIIYDLLNQVVTNYDYYLEFFKTYSVQDNETILELQKTKSDLYNFMIGLQQVTEKDIAKTQEVINDAVEYLKKLDDISSQLKSHKDLSTKITLGKQLSKTLHAMCGIEEIEELLCSDLVSQLHKLICGCETLLSSLESLNSPFIHHFYNEYQGLIQEFQVSVKILTDICLANAAEYSILSKALVSLMRTK